MIQITLAAGINNAHQRFSQRLGSALISFQVDYLSYTESPYWVLNVLQDGFPIAMGLPLNCGADLMANHNLPDFGQLVFVGEPATLDNLGIANSLIWIPA